jgi:hypothetical protein
MFELLKSMDCMPVAYNSYNKASAPASNGNGQVEAPAETNDPSWCPVHKVTMRKYDKNGKTWYAHSTDNGWCNEKDRKAAGF